MVYRSTFDSSEHLFQYDTGCIFFFFLFGTHIFFFLAYTSLLLHTSYFPSLDKEEYKVFFFSFNHFSWGCSHIVFT